MSVRLDMASSTMTTSHVCSDLFRRRFNQKTIDFGFQCGGDIILISEAFADARIESGLRKRIFETINWKTYRYLGSKTLGFLSK